MESRKFRHNRYLTKLEKHAEDASSAAKYSSDRFDILIISISTTSLILSVSLVEKLTSNTVILEILFLKLSWIAFASSLISNLLSQVTGYLTNTYEVKISKNLIREERGGGMKGDQDLICKISAILNDTTFSLNILSLLTLIIGIILITTFLINNF